MALFKKICWLQCPITIVRAIVLLSIIFQYCTGGLDTEMPQLNIRLSDSTTVINTSKIVEGKPTVFIHFDAECGDCQQEADTLMKYMNSMQDVRFFFITTQEFEKVKLFRNYYKMERFSNVNVGQDFEKRFPKHFKSHATPLLAIYSTRNQLMGVIQGKATMDLFLSKIDEARKN